MGGDGDGAVEADVVDEERLRILQRREHSGHLFRHGGQVVAGGALGGEPGRRDLEHAPGVEHVVAREAVQRGHQAEGPGRELRRSGGDEAARAVARFDDAHRGQRAQAGADGGPADLDLERQLPFRRQAVAGLELTGLDEPLDVGDDAFGGQRLVDWRAVGTRYRGRVIGHT